MGVVEAAAVEAAKEGVPPDACLARQGVQLGRAVGGRPPADPLRGVRWV